MSESAKYADDREARRDRVLRQSAEDFVSRMMSLFGQEVNFKDHHRTVERVMAAVRLPNPQRQEAGE